jgi:protein involved in polysaccharide export with SLBB domain
MMRAFPLDRLTTITILMAVGIALHVTVRPAAAQSAEPGPIPAEVESVVRPGDVLRITVWRKPELSGEYPVTAEGTVGEPFYMSVVVAGVPFAEAAARVRAHVGRYESEPLVLVEPLFRVGVGGEVQRPDLYTFDRSVTVGQAVLLAGGPTPRADPARVWLYRAGDRLRVELHSPDDTVARSPIRSGDYVMVATERHVVREVVLPALLGVGAAASIVRLFVR